jgi:hypothetical protein
MNRKQSKQLSGKPRRRSPVKGSSGNRPPQFSPTLKFGHRFRFTSGTNAGTFIIERENLLDLYCMAATASTAFRIIEGIRLKSVEIWTNPVALGQPPTTCSVEWVGTNGPSTVHSDTGMGVQPAHVFSRPPPRSSDQWWSMSGSNEADPLFTLVLPADSVIDVICDVRLVELEAATAVTAEPTGATAGTIYGNYLDGLTSGKLTPVGLTVIP